MARHTPSLVCREKSKYLPASLSTVCAFAQFLSRSFKSVSSIRNNLYAVKVLHILHGYDFTHLEAIEYKLLMRGLARLKMHHVKQAAPITPDILAAIFNILTFHQLPM